MASRILSKIVSHKIKTFKIHSTLCYNIKNFSSNTDSGSEDYMKHSTELYNKIALNYNTLNDVVTLFLHRSWRKAIIDNIPVRVDSKILDVPGGTGANTLRLLKKAKKQNLVSDFVIEVMDINPYMLKIGQDNFKKLGYNESLVKFSEGDIHNLPFQDESFEAVVLSFSIRGAINLSLALEELHRVLKPKGKIVVMDFLYYKHPTFIQRLYCLYLEHIASIIEKTFFYKNPVGMEYLVSEIREVIGKTDIETLLKESKFQNVKFKPLSLGIAALTLGVKSQ